MAQQTRVVLMMSYRRDRRIDRWREPENQRLFTFIRQRTCVTYRSTNAPVPRGVRTTVSRTAWSAAVWRLVCVLTFFPAYLCCSCVDSIAELLLPVVKFSWNGPERRSGTCVCRSTTWNCRSTMHLKLSFHHLVMTFRHHLGENH